MNKLSVRETEVLEYVARGYTSRQVALYLSIGEGTVKHHLKSIFIKLGAANRTEAAVIGVRQGLI